MPTPITIPKRSAWVSQALVINALLKREIATRFGEYKLGFIWMLFEPLLGVLVVGLVIGSIAGRSVPEIPYPFFLLNGMLLLKLLTGSMNSGINSIGSNQGLLVYATVRPLDTFIARFIYELMTTVFSFLLFCSISIWMGIQVSLGHLHLLAACYILVWLTGAGLGLIFGVAAAHFKEMEKVVLVIQRPLLFVSAVLFPLSAMPESSQPYFLMNPLVHAIELSRHALFPYYHTDGVNLFYPTTFALVVLSIGLTLFHGNRSFLSQR